MLGYDISKIYFSLWKTPGVSERMCSVNLDASISGEYQTLGGHSCRPSMQPGSLMNGTGVPSSAKKYSVRAEWLRQSGCAPSEASETPRWRITPRPVSIQRIALYITLRSLFHCLFALCRSPIVNDLSRVVANCDNTLEWVHWVRTCIEIAKR